MTTGGSGQTRKILVFGHVALRAVVFGLAAYGAIHLLSLAIDGLKGWL
ncbi:MAG: hypothetical protein WEB93_07415 [Sphingomonadales bacterium]